VTRYVEVWTLRRGVVSPAEPLDAANQWLANVAAETTDTADIDTLRSRATAAYRLERDPLPKPAEMARLARHVKPERMDIERAVRLAGMRGA
jgi:hypothetical protein